MTALLVVATILALVVIDIVVMVARRRRGVAPAVAPEAMRRPHTPHGLFLDPAHTWVRLQSDGSLRVGVDDFLADALGSVEGVEPSPVGSKLERGQPLLTLRTRGGRRVVLRSPAGGEVVAVNQSAIQSPGTIAADPYGLGWIVGLWPRDHKQALAPLFVGTGASAFLLQELQRLCEFFGGAPAQNGAPVMADGGVPLRGAVSRLSDADLELFQRQFLSPPSDGDPSKTR